MGRTTYTMLRGSFVALLCVALIPLNAIAQSESTNYRLIESSIGSGSAIQSSSSNFQARESIGDIAVGNAASANFQVDSGAVTTNEPNLAVNIPVGDIIFPSFSAVIPSVTTATFSVLNYTSYGYVVQIIGTPPNNDGYTIAPLTSNSPSVAGTEQFGINLVANTSPASVGANPFNDVFGFGEASPNYGTPNEFRFVSGETIALAPKSSGVTEYTISYLVNVAGLTPGGQYVSNQTLVITGTY